MSMLNPNARAKSSSISAVVTRADGTVENRGVVSYWHRNPVINLIGKLYVKVNYALGEYRRNRRKRP